MKKLTFALLGCSLLLSSCGTLFNGGQATAHQTTKPTPPQKRQLKAGAFIADILLFPPALILDFANGKIYKKEAK